MSDFASDFQWQTRFLGEAKCALAEHLFIEAPFQEDARRNTDLMALEARNLRISCRIRKHHYLNLYPDQFTIRTDRPSGAMTELEKVVSGWGDYTFYGFADKGERRLAAWMIGDLSVFRLWFNKKLAAKEFPGVTCNNRDGTRFRAFRIADMPDEFVKAQRVLRAA